MKTFSGPVLYVGKSLIVHNYVYDMLLPKTLSKPVGVSVYVPTPLCKWYVLLSGNEQLKWQVKSILKWRLAFEQLYDRNQTTTTRNLICPNVFHLSFYKIQWH